MASRRHKAPPRSLTFDGIGIAPVPRPPSFLLQPFVHPSHVQRRSPAHILTTSRRVRRCVSRTGPGPSPSALPLAAGCPVHIGDVGRQKLEGNPTAAQQGPPLLDSTLTSSKIPSGRPRVTHALGESCIRVCTGVPVVRIRRRE